MARTESTVSSANVLIQVQQQQRLPDVVNAGAQIQVRNPPPGSPSPPRTHRPEAKVRNDDLSRKLCALIKAHKTEEVITFLDGHPKFDLNISPTTRDDLPLHLGCESRDKRIVKCLLDAGASPESFCRRGFNVLQCTASYLDTDLLSLLTRGYEHREVERQKFINSLDQRQNQRATHRVVECRSENLEGVIALQKAGADWILKDQNKNTPFEMAVVNRHLSIASCIADMQWHNHYREIKAEYVFSFYSTCNWTQLDGQNTAYIQGFVWRTLSDSANKHLRDGILQHITPYFRSGRDPKDPVGGNGRESVYFSKKLDESEFMSIAIPYFSADKTGSIRYRRDCYRSLIQDFKYCSDHNFSHLGFQCASTLDEYCHPYLGHDVLADRNEDQVLSRYQQKASRDERMILTVPQLWLWKFGNNIITALPQQRYGAYEVFGSFKWSKYENSEALTSQKFSDLRRECEDLNLRLEDLIVGTLISECVNRLNSGLLLSESVFCIFERSIFMLSVRVRDYTKLEAWKKNNIDSEKGFILQIGDVREELSMIQSVLFEQEEVWRQFMKAKFPSLDHWSGPPQDQFSIPSQATGTLLDVMETLKRPQTQFAKYKLQIARLDADAERVEGFITLQLDLKSKHASLQETHLTTLMSAAIIGFTVVTIIFTPLAFLASLFALSTDRFQNNQHNSTLASGAPFYHGSYIRKWMVIIEFGSLFVTSFAIWLALRLTRGYSIMEAAEKVWDSAEQGSLLWGARRQEEEPHNVASAAKTEEQLAAAKHTTVASDEKQPLWKRLRRRPRQQHLESGKEQ